MNFQSYRTKRGNLWTNFGNFGLCVAEDDIILSSLVLIFIFSHCAYGCFLNHLKLHPSIIKGLLFPLFFSYKIIVKLTKIQGVFSLYPQTMNKNLGIYWLERLNFDFGYHFGENSKIAHNLFDSKSKWENCFGKSLIIYQIRIFQVSINVLGL